jgi:hypothetical protein
LGAGAFLINGCKPKGDQPCSTTPGTETASLVRQQLKLNSATDLPDLNKHRAFMLTWLLVTANRSILQTDSPNLYQGLANALGQHISDSDVGTVFSQARGNPGYFPTVVDQFEKLDPTNPVFTASASDTVSLVSSLINPQATLDRHRAFLTSWLLVTTNPDWVDSHCRPDYAGISSVLGNQVSPAEVEKVFDSAKSNAEQFTHLGAALFNSLPLKQISGYDIAFYCCRDCPIRMSQIVIDLMNPKATGTFKEPTGCPAN